MARPLRLPPPQGRGSIRQWPAPSLQFSGFLTWSSGMHCASLPLECRAVPVSQCLRPCHAPAPHPQPHPASLVLSHHGDRISKWEGLESPHILPPPTRVPLRPTFCGSQIHMCGGGGDPAVGGRQEGNTSPWGGPCSAPSPPIQQASPHRCPPAGFRGHMVLNSFLGSVSLGFALPWELRLCRRGSQPAASQPDPMQTEFAKEEASEPTDIRAD